ncbi:hypothetical protein PG997_006251 [Apiospora hydei]|uniref:Uncharacterized protein n=1 Tax=Apiospora hydei TaxID=1337664 RepID=A0ABR1WR70_9PEZI
MNGIRSPSPASVEGIVAVAAALRARSAGPEKVKVDQCNAACGVGGGLFGSHRSCRVVGFLQKLLVGEVEEWQKNVAPRHVARRDLLGAERLPATRLRQETGHLRLARHVHAAVQAVHDEHEAARDQVCL